MLTVIFLSCKNVDNKSHSTDHSIPTTNVEQPKVDSTKNHLITHKRIGDFMSDTTDYFWSAKQSEVGSYWIRVVFQEEFAVYQFHGQCLYWFFTNHYNTRTDAVELLWSYKTDCVLPMDFLKKSNGIKKYPKFGDAFCEYTLVNDSVIRVKYNFPQWAEKVNRIAKDSIFPTYLYLNKKGGI
jgi:hypothetical protein